MKNINMAVFIFFLNIPLVYSQQFSTKVPTDYDKAKMLSVINQNNDTVFSILRNGKEKIIKTSDYQRVLIKRKVLMDIQGDTVAIYKNKKIIFPSHGIIIKEETLKNSWKYYLANELILEIKYSNVEKEEEYQIDIITDRVNDIIFSLMQISLGKFDKRVVMDYHNDIDDYFIPIIIAIIIIMR